MEFPQTEGELMEECSNCSEMIEFEDDQRDCEKCGVIECATCFEAEGRDGNLCTGCHPEEEDEEEEDDEVVFSCRSCGYRWGSEDEDAEAVPVDTCARCDPAPLRNPMGRHTTIKRPGDPTFSKEWSGVSRAPTARGVVCSRCGGHVHREAGEYYCPYDDDYVRIVRR